MSGRSYLSIGDVLTLLRHEFPDVTISKIRFLESQGLVNPERTPSGYRKFYEQDVERLRWVLRQQRENFLPLKVIKGRLEDGGDATDEAEESTDAENGQVRGVGVGGGAAALPGFEGDPRAGGARRVDGPASADASAGRGSRPATVRGAQVAAGGTPPKTATPARAAATEVLDPAPSDGGSRRSAGRRGRVDDAPAPPVGPDELTLDELAAASGCSADHVAGLESFGLLSGRRVGSMVVYGQDALDVAKVAARFALHGVEPRHLRLHKHAAEREAGFVEQVVMPLLKQRNPESRRRARETVDELSDLGRQLREILLRRALNDQLGG